MMIITLPDTVESFTPTGLHTKHAANRWAATLDGSKRSHRNQPPVKTSQRISPRKAVAETLSCTCRRKTTNTSVTNNSGTGILVAVLI
jgi:hypothetical protein